MTLASVSVVDVLQKGTSAITGQADANGLTIGGLQRHRASASLIAGSGRSNKTNLRKTGVQFLRWSVRELCTVTTDMTTGRADGWMTSMGSDGKATGSGNVFACRGVCRARHSQNDLCAVHLDQGIR
jgi:hypothetical protein